MDKKNPNLSPPPENEAKKLNIRFKAHTPLNIEEANPKALKLKKKKEVLSPIIADESQYTPIEPIQLKSKKPLLIGIILFFAALLVVFYFIGSAQEKLKQEYAQATEWNNWTGNYYEAYQSEKEFHEEVRTSWLRLVSIKDLEKNHEFVLGESIMDAVSNVGKERTVSELVSILSLKTPSYTYFNAAKNQRSIELLNAKREASIIHDSDDVLFTNTFLYTVLFRGDSREWCHSLEKIGDTYRLSAYQSPAILNYRTLESFETTAVFINDHRLSEAELAQLIQQTLEAKKNAQ